MRNSNLVKEIVESASKIPVEYQEHILEIIKAMIFTREIIEQEHSSEMIPENHNENDIGKSQLSIDRSKQHKKITHQQPADKNERKRRK